MYRSLIKKKFFLTVLLIAASASGAHAQADNSKLIGNGVVQPPVRSKSVVRGRAVFDDTGLPAVEATVRLIDPKDPRRMGGMITNERGGFGLGSIPPGEYFLVVQPATEFAAGRPTWQFPLRTGDEAFDAARLEEFTRGFPKIIVDGLNSIQIEVRVPRRHGGMIAGRITGANSAPIPDASVNILRKLSKGLQVIESARTNSEGEFRVGRLPAGDYLVRAIALDKKESVDTRKVELPGAVYFTSATDVNDAVPVTVLPEQDTEGINISLEVHPLATVSGLLRMRGTEKPLANVLVGLMGQGRDHFVNTDQEGRWSFPHVAIGKYTLRSGTSGVSLTPTEPPSAPPFVHRYQELTVGDSDIKDIVVELSEGGRISGSVLLEGNPSTKPNSISILANSQAGDGQNPAGAQVNPDGSFSISGVPLGEVTVRASVFPFKEYVTKSIRWNGVDLLKEKLNVVEDSDIRNVVIVIAPVRPPH